MVLHEDEGIKKYNEAICDLEERKSGSNRERGFRQEEVEVRKCFYLKKSRGRGKEGLYLQVIREKQESYPFRRIWKMNAEKSFRYWKLRHMPLTGERI